VHCKGTDYAAFFGAQSAQKSKKYDTDAANANARLSAQLPYILAMSRFAHYLKAMMRDKIGSFMSRSGLRVLPQPLDHQLRDLGRQRLPCLQSPEAPPEARVEVSEGRRQARRVQGGGVPAAAFPARRVVGVSAAGAELPQSTRK